MPKNIKKAYCFLNLPYTANKEEIQRQEKVLIKIERAKALKNGKSRKVKINKIVKHSNNILEYIEQNGIPKHSEEVFISTYKDIILELCILIAVSVVGFIGFFSLI